MGARGCLGQAVYDLAVECEDFCVVSADLGLASGFQRFMNDYSSRFYDVGIAEQNLIGFAAGFSSDDRPVVATSWAAFASYRCADQIRNYMELMRSNIKLIGMDSGVTISRFGGSHYAIGDIAMLRSIPGISVISPVDGFEIYQVIQAVLQDDSPTYIRLTGGETLPIIHKDPEYRFELGKASVLRNGEDVIIFCHGAISNECLKAADILEADKISCGVIAMSTIKPLDKEIINKYLHCGLFVSVEEHSIYGGLGSAIAEYTSGLEIRPKQLLLGIDDFIPMTGSYEYILETCGLLGHQIANRVLREMI